MLKLKPINQSFFSDVGAVESNRLVCLKVGVRFIGSLEIRKDKLNK